MLEQILTWLQSGPDVDRAFALEWLAQEATSVPPEAAAPLCLAMLRHSPDHLEACLAADALGRVDPARAAPLLGPEHEAGLLLSCVSGWARDLGRAPGALITLLEAVEPPGPEELETTATALDAHQLDVVLRIAPDALDRDQGPAVHRLQRLLASAAFEPWRKAQLSACEALMAPEGDVSIAALELAVTALAWLPPSEPASHLLLRIVEEHHHDRAAGRAVSILRAGAVLTAEQARLTAALAIWDDLDPAMSEHLVDLLVERGADALRVAREVLRDHPGGQVNQAAFERLRSGGRRAGGGDGA